MAKKITITITGDEEEMGGYVNYDQLFSHDEPEKEEEYNSELASKIKRRMQWRGKNPGCTIFKNDQVIDSVEMRKGQLVFKYHMNSDITRTEHEFRVPSDNLPFIEEAVEAGIIGVGKPLWVTVESDKKKHNRWIMVEEK